MSGHNFTGTVKRLSSPLLPGLNYIPGSTILHDLHPAVKLWILIFYSLGVFTYPGPLPGLTLTIVLIAAYKTAGLGFAYFMRKLRFFIIFGLMIMAVQVLTVREGVLLWTLPLGGCG